jgi:predicted phage terminase large subunit-like protein
MSNLKSLIQQKAKQNPKLIRDYFSEPENIVAFSYLFKQHIESQVPEFHKEIYTMFTELRGNKVIAAPRGFSKSTITDLVYLSWVVLHNKKNFIVLISDTHTQSTMLLDAFKQEMESNELIRWLYGEVVTDKWTQEDIEIDAPNARVRIMARGAGMKIRGIKFRSYRPDLIIIDDLENDQLVMSIERRKKLRNWLKMSVLPALAKNGEVVMIGTTLHRDSLLTNAIQLKDEFKGWHAKKYQAISDDNKSLWPERFSYEELVAMRDTPNSERYIGPVSFSQEMQNSPISDEDQIIKPEWLNQRFNLQELLNQYHTENPQVDQAEITNSFLRDKFKMIIGAVDPAISEKSTADWWAMVTIGIARDNGHIWILDYHRVRESDPLVQVGIVLDKHQEWRHDRIKVESVAYQQGLQQLINRVGAERNIYAPTVAYRPDKDKVRRAIVQSASFAGNLIHIRVDHPLLNAFLDEVVQFPQGNHDDMFDAFMMAAEDVTMRSNIRTFKNKPPGF